MSKLFSIFACFVILPALSAQNTCLEQLDKEGIYLRSEFWRGTTMVKGTQSKTVGFLFRHIAPEFEQYPVSRKLFKNAQRNNKAAFFTGLIGITGMITGLALNTSAIDEYGNITNQKKFNAGNGLILGSAVFTLAVAVPLRIKSERQLADAVWARNREVMGRE